jgi:glutamate-1-semialdehyde 2,1-aminomutase
MSSTPTDERPRFSRSIELHAEAARYLPGGVSSHFRLGMKPVPLFFTGAHDSRLVDADGHTYIDYALGMGPILLGHADPDVNAAVAASLAQGQLYAGQHRMELTLARTLCEILPCAERVRFSMSGTEAIQAALRVARAFTNKPKVVKFEGHYHGWLDNVFVSVRPDEARRGPGDAPNTVPESRGQDTNAYASQIVLPWNDFDVLRARLERDRDVAAVVMEPMMCNTSVILPKAGYLERVRELCTRLGVLLIFDEVVTGFRVALGGAQSLFGVTPDLAAFAKAMANGYPISCLAGRADVMELLGTGTVVHGGTYNANTTSCAAALAVIRRLRSDGGAIYGRLREAGCSLMEGLRECAAEHGVSLLVQGLPTVFHVAFVDGGDITGFRSHQRCDALAQRRFVSDLLLRGVRVTDRGTWFLSASHTPDDIQETLTAAGEVLHGFATTQQSAGRSR